MVQGYPYYGDIQNYFPTVSTYDALEFKPIFVDKKQRDEGWFPFYHHYTGLDKITINDSHLIDQSRMMEFLNVKRRT